MALKRYSNQGEMWGPSPDLILPAGHLARAIDEIVEKLGLERLNRKYLHTPGEPAYDVRVVVKVLIYAYGRGITSSREMARQCEENIAFRYLTRDQCPDFRTISLFRRKKHHLLVWVFKKTVQLARQLGMVRLGLVGLDSVKLGANASSDKKMTAEELRKQIEDLDGYLKRAEESDKKEDEQYGPEERGDELPAELRSAQRRKEKLQEALEILERRPPAKSGEGRKDVSPGDAEAVWVKKGGKFIRGYSAQVAADAEHQIIVALKPTAESTDSEQLNPMRCQIEATTGQPAEKLVADSGYYSDDAVLEAARSETDCYVPDGNTAANLNNPQRAEKLSPFHWSRFEYDKEKDEFICPEGKRLPFLKDHYRRTETKIYRGLDCQSCPVRSQCTEHASGFRNIQVRPDHAQVREIRQKLETEKGIKLYKKRKAIIEPIFGRWQHNWGVRRIRLRGLTGFSIEVHLLAIAHNLTKLCRLPPIAAEVGAKG
jgi:transposase